MVFFGALYHKSSKMEELFKGGYRNEKKKLSRLSAVSLASAVLPLGKIKSRIGASFFEKFGQLRSESEGSFWPEWFAEPLKTF